MSINDTSVRFKQPSTVCPSELSSSKCWKVVPENEVASNCMASMAWSTLGPSPAKTSIAHLIAQSIVVSPPALGYWWPAKIKIAADSLPAA